MDKTNIPTVIRFANFTDMHSRTIYCTNWKDDYDEYGGEDEDETKLSLTQPLLLFHLLSSTSLHMPQDFSDIGSGIK